jgi:hypothetical protein
MKYFHLPAVQISYPMDRSVLFTAYKLSKLCENLSSVTYYLNFMQFMQKN